MEKNGSCSAAFCESAALWACALAPPWGSEPSQALPRQLSQRESQGLRLVAKVLGIMRKLPAVLLALPLGELSPQVTERARREAAATRKTRRPFEIVFFARCNVP